MCIVMIFFKSFITYFGQAGDLIGLMGEHYLFTLRSGMAQMHDQSHWPFLRLSSQN